VLDGAIAQDLFALAEISPGRGAQRLRERLGGGRDAGSALGLGTLGGARRWPGG
jgi:hypothetical protein